MSEAKTTPDQISRIVISAPARLHMGFMDLNGENGRSFGGLGVAINCLSTTVEIEPAETTSVDGPPAEVTRVERVIGKLTAHGFFSRQSRIKIHQAIPSHAGLGSGTQMSLAVGHALAKFNQWSLTTREIAHITERGGRSGIGIGAYDTGGFIVDGGRGPDRMPPHVISRLSFPEKWRILLVLGGHHQGIHGTHEITAFRALPSFPEEKAAYLCRLVLLQALPAIAEDNVHEFGKAITTLQEVIGDHFAPQQGGRFANPMVAEILEWLKIKGAAGIGQSSWGPTGFAIFGSEGEALTAMSHARAQWPESELVSFKLCSGLNHGATVTKSAAESAGGHSCLMACNL